MVEQNHNYVEQAKALEAPIPKLTVEGAGEDSAFWNTNDDLLTKAW